MRSGVGDPGLVGGWISSSATMARSAAMRPVPPLLGPPPAALSASSPTRPRRLLGGDPGGRAGSGMSPELCAGELPPALRGGGEGMGECGTTLLPLPWRCADSLWSPPEAVQD